MTIDINDMDAADELPKRTRIRPHGFTYPKWLEHANCKPSDCREARYNLNNR